MDPLAGAIAELHLHLPKIVLTELSGKTFEANQRLRRLRAKRGHQRIEHCLSSAIAGFQSSASWGVAALFIGMLAGVATLLQRRGRSTSG